jgi:hypothetical protein
VEVRQEDRGGKLPLSVLSSLFAVGGWCLHSVEEHSFEPHAAVGAGQRGGNEIGS